MIEYFDAIDLAIIGKSFVKKDFFNELIKNKKIDLKKYYTLGVDDKLGILKITNELKKKGYKAKSFWINRENFNPYPKKYYDYEIKSLKEIIKFIDSNKIKNPLLIIDFDNTLAKANYELTHRTMKENNFWDKLPINFLTIAIIRFLAPFTLFTILADLIKPSNTIYKDAKEFKNYLDKKNVNSWIISYRNKLLQKKYF